MEEEWPQSVPRDSHLTLLWDVQLNDSKTGTKGVDHSGSTTARLATSRRWERPATLASTLSQQLLRNVRLNIKLQQEVALAHSQEIRNWMREPALQLATVLRSNSARSGLMRCSCRNSNQLKVHREAAKISLTKCRLRLASITPDTSAALNLLL